MGDVSVGTPQREVDFTASVEKEWRGFEWKAAPHASLLDLVANLSPVRICFVSSPLPPSYRDFFGADGFKNSCLAFIDAPNRFSWSPNRCY